MRFTTTLDSPVGPLALVSDGAALTAVSFVERPAAGRRGMPEVADDFAAPFAQSKRELAEYFEGQRTSFEIPIAPEGTPFQTSVWEALRRIPYGATATYGEIARQIGSPDAVRAVGAANGRNPLAIVVPCHRVVGADGNLTGYGGGLLRKRALLELEAAHAPASEKSGKLF